MSTLHVRHAIAQVSYRVKHEILQHPHTENVAEDVGEILKEVGLVFFFFSFYFFFFRFSNFILFNLILLLMTATYSLEAFGQPRFLVFALGGCSRQVDFFVSWYVCSILPFFLFFPIWNLIDPLTARTNGLQFDHAPSVQHLEQ
jgi:hypothetical protein